MSPYVSIQMKKDIAKQAKQPIAEMPEKLEDRVSFSGINYLFDQFVDLKQLVQKQQDSIAQLTDELTNEKRSYSLALF